jgi:hypothetical protein
VAEREEILHDLGEALSGARTARAALMRHVSRLYSPDEARARWGEFVSAPEAIDSVIGDIQRKRVEVRDSREICTKWGCTDLADFLTSADDYFKASGKRARAEFKLDRLIVRGY